MKVDSSVVQICCFEEYLLISTKTRSYICDTRKEQFKQIGTQLREGFYGATFIKCGNGFKIYCARPGSRLWEVDDSGNIISTHQLKKLLPIQSSAVVRLEENELILSSKKNRPDRLSFNFCSLLNVFDKFLITFQSDLICIFDPTTAEVVLWLDYYKDIVKIKSFQDIIYLWNSSGQLYSLVITPLSTCLVQLYLLGKYKLCTDVLEAFLVEAMSDSIMSKVSCLVGLKENFPDICNNPKVYKYIERLLSDIKDKQTFSCFDSGIFLVDNKHWKKWKIGIKRNKFSRKKMFFHSYSMSDISEMHTKPDNQTNKFNYISLPDIQFLLNDNFSSKSHRSDDFLNNCSSYLSNSFMNQIPFLSLTSPDVIQGAILELGHNVKRKLYNSTKLLQNKLQFIEEKIKFSKGYIKSELHDVNLKCFNSDISTKNIDSFSMNDAIVYNQPYIESVKDCLFVTSDICLFSEKINDSFTEEETFFLFNLLITKLNKYNQCLSPGENIMKSFPFKQTLPEKNIIIIRNLFCNSFRNGWIVKYIDQFKALNMKCLVWQEHPMILKEIHGPLDLVNDLIFSNILVLFSEVLDPCSVLQCLANLELVCTFFSCSIVLDIFQEASFSSFASKKDVTFSYLECPLPFVLNVLYLMLRLNQIESACHIAVMGKIKLPYVSYLILKLSMDLELIGINNQHCANQCNKLFLNFLTKLNDKKLLLLSDVYDNEMLHHIESSFFSVNKHLFPTCNCCYPLIGSSKYLVNYPAIGELLFKQKLCFFRIARTSDLMSNNKSCYYSLRPQAITNCLEEEEIMLSEYLKLKHIQFPINLFQNNFYINNFFSDKSHNNENGAVYSKMISLLQVMPDLIILILNYCLHNIDLCLPLIVQFGKISILDNFIENGSYGFWNKAFDFNLLLSKGFCCICQGKSKIDVKVDWNDLSLLTLRSLGAKETIQLMVKYADTISSSEINIRVEREEKSKFWKKIKQLKQKQFYHFGLIPLITRNI